MDALAQHHYEIKLQAVFLTMTGDEFQAFFSRVMSKAHLGDFEPTRPWGNLGDRKCDGFLRSSRTLYQCYAPNTLTLTEAKEKIREDFEGALPYRGTYWDNWTFVHNSRDGRIATDVSQFLQSLRNVHPCMTIVSWGYEEIRSLVFKLPEFELVSLLGAPPTARSFENISFADLEPIFEALDGRETPADVEVRPTPAGKIEHNKLGAAPVVFLKVGMTYAKRVRDFFTSHPDKELGDRITARFNREYLRLRAQGESPDAIFAQLFTFVHGPLGSADARATTSYAILAFMFEECEIFERPPTSDPLPSLP